MTYRYIDYLPVGPFGYRYDKGRKQYQFGLHVKNTGMVKE